MLVIGEYKIHILRRRGRGTYRRKENMETVIYVMSCSLSLLTMLIVTDGIMMLSVMYSMYCTLLLAREKDGSMVIWNCHCIYWE